MLDSDTIEASIARLNQYLYVLVFFDFRLFGTVSIYLYVYNDFYKSIFWSFSLRVYFKVKLKINTKKRQGRSVQALSRPFTSFSLYHAYALIIIYFIYFFSEFTHLNQCLLSFPFTFISFHSLIPSVT